MKKISLLLFFIFLSSTTFAQQEINTTFKTQMNTTFGNLDKNRVPHGILLDYGMEFTNIPRYNGTLTDSTYTDMTAMSQIYKTLLTSRIRDVSTGFVKPTDYDTRWRNNRSSNFIAIGGLYFKYSQVADNAVTTNKITVTNGIAYDKFIGGVWQNPYEEFQTFAMTPAIKKHDGLNLQVRIPSSIFYSNYQSLVQSIQIDFDNGVGYITIPFDQNFAVNYTTEGVKNWKYKLNLTNGTTLYNQSRIKVLEGLNAVPYGSATPMVVPSANTTTNATTLYSHTITGTKLYAGATATVKLTIDLGAGHTQITKPLIVAEGFDIGVILSPENANGMSNYSTFRNFVFEGGSELKNLIYENYKQYDIIYVDWNNGVDYMQRNAFALEEVIKWVNTQKALAGSTEKNVVLGQSMGGVIVRYALADMEQDGLDHKTRLFVSHDAPQQGANIPVSLQFMYRHLTNQYLQTPVVLFGGEILVQLFSGIDVSDYLSILDAPASRQLLSNWSKLNYTIDNSVHNTFFNELKSKGAPNSGGYPINCRNIAISNGAECGTGQGFNPNSDLVNYNWNKGLTFGGDLLSMIYLPLGGTVAGVFVDASFFGVILTGLIPGKSKYNVEFNAKAIPYGSGNQIYKGRISYTKKVLWIGPNITINITNVQKNQPLGILPIDTYGGGFYNTSIIAGTLSVPNLYVRDKFNFIPTTSALDIGQRNVTLNDSDYKMAYVGATPPTNPKNSPFANFSTDFDKYNSNAHNKQHISFNTRNGKWLANELLTTPITTNCSFICSDAKINGVDNFCSSTNYFVSNAASTFNWSITSGNNLAVISSGQGTNSVILSVVNTNLYGFVTLSCYIGNFECGYNTLVKTIWVGKPANLQANYITGGYDNVSIGSSNSFNINAVSGATSYQWRVIPINTNDNNLPNCQSASITGTGTTANVNWGTCVGNYEVSVLAINSCGTKSVDYKIVNVFTNSGGGGGGGNPCDTASVQISPNPVRTGTIIMDVIYPPCDDTDPNARAAISNTVDIYNFQGNKVYTNQFASSSINITNINLTRGHYIINVSTERGQTIRKTLIVQ